MNQLSTEKRARIMACLVEGLSIRSTARITGFAINTIMKLNAEVGFQCMQYQREVFNNLSCKRIEVDEIWAFCKMKEKKVPAILKGEIGLGDVYTWVALCPDTKIVPCYLVGRRDLEHAKDFIEDLASRLKHRIQLTSDGHKPYLEAVEGAFGSDIDYAMLIKNYGGERTYRDGTTKKCRRSECSSITTWVVNGQPNPDKISTSLIERQNLTMRMSMRRFTRKTNAHSKKWWNHECAIAMHFMWYNFARIHETLRITPAMEAGLTNRLWSFEDIVSLKA